MAIIAHSGLDPAILFRVRDEVGIEDFGERSLVFLSDSLRLREINGQSRRLLALVDGERRAQEIARSVAVEFGTPAPEAWADVAHALLEMERQGIVRRVVKLSRERFGEMSEAEYLANPEVSFRQEDDDGGILFNTDTEALEVINPVAVEIWTFLAAPRTLDAVVEHLLGVFADAPGEQVRADVGEFLDSLLRKGFIGVVEKGS